MRMYIFILLLSIFGQSSAQKVITEKRTIQSILNNHYECQVMIGEVSTIFNPSIRLWGFNPQTYEPRVLNIKERCVSIEYSIEKDNNGSSYKRLLLIPVSLLQVKKFDEDDLVYYEDSWTEKGPRFDRQGGSYKANDMIKEIIGNIKYYSK